MRLANRRSRIEQLVEVVLNGPSETEDAELTRWAREIDAFDARQARVVVLGGGTGLSTVVGGNSALPEWTDNPFVGLKQEFAELDVIVCTTDDGGSTGELLKSLPMIGIGDLRKSCLSLIREDRLAATYSLTPSLVGRLIEVIQQVFNYRFPRSHVDHSRLRDPLLAAHPDLVGVAPPALRTWLADLGQSLTPDGRGPTVDVAGNCLGNLVLTAAVFRAAGGDTTRPPTLEHLRSGLDEVAHNIGSAVGRLHPATATPGQLKFRYANGVEVYGQRKAGLARRGFAVQRVEAEFAGVPLVSEALRQVIKNADLIICAPGSVYSSMIPVLQLEPIVEAIRHNRRARKILAANFWIQRGETDISAHRQDRGFLVSELIEAYHQNIPGGVHGLFELVLCADLEHVPGSILRNYALEGKRAIHLDRPQVEAMGLPAVEATLFDRTRLDVPGFIHHDPGNFARAVRTLWYVHQHPEVLRGTELPIGPEVSPSSRRGQLGASSRTHGQLLCAYRDSIEAALATKRFEPESLRSTMLDLAWDNRDLRPDHLRYFDTVQVVAAADWGRSTEWDNVLGYYDSESRTLKAQDRLLGDPNRLREALLIALGESLLGRYIESRRWLEEPAQIPRTGRCYEIRLLPVAERDCFLTDEQLRTFLLLARMVPDPADRLVHRLVLNDDEGFIPSGLLFGLLFAWYLDSSYGVAMEYEMSLLGWPRRALMPHHAKERARKAELVRFFCEEVFGHPPVGGRKG